MAFISKSKFLWGLQCQKLLWHAYNAKNLIPEPDTSQQAIYDQGHEVGALSKQLFPRGIEVGQGIVDIESVLKLSQTVIKQRRPLFEAAFTPSMAATRALTFSILWTKTHGTSLRSKSSTSVKDVYLPDLAFQCFVYSGAGLKIRRCFVCCTSTAITFGTATLTRASFSNKWMSPHRFLICPGRLRHNWRRCQKSSALMNRRRSQLVNIGEPLRHMNVRCMSIVGNSFQPTTR